MSDLYCPTPFLESNALLAVQAGMDEDAWAIIARLLPGERRELSEACRKLAGMLNETCTVCHRRIERRDYAMDQSQRHERCASVAQLTELERRLR